MRAPRHVRIVSLLIVLMPALCFAQASVPAHRDAAAGKQPARPAPAARGKPAAKKKAPPEPSLPPAPVRLWIVAPSPDGPWTLRLDNEGTRGVRIAADVRLLRFEIDIGEKKPIRCTVPDGLRPKGFPEDRALLLGPGQSYIESFDPRLICFGDSAKGLVGAAVVRSSFGWAPPGRGQKQPAGGPFVAEGIDVPETFAPLREVAAPTFVLSYALPAGAPEQSAPGKQESAPGKQEKEPAGAASAGKEAAKPPGTGTATPLVDARAPRLELSAKPYVEAESARGVTVTVTAKNAGQRPMLVALRSRMLSFRVQGADGKETVCGGGPPTRSIPRDGFNTLKPGGTSSFTVMLSEVCPRGTFPRPGLYRVAPTLEANESGETVGVAAYTGSADAPKPAWVRLKTGTDPFYASPPQAVATPGSQTGGAGER